MRCFTVFLLTWNLNAIRHKPILASSFRNYYVQHMEQWPTYRAGFALDITLALKNKATMASKQPKRQPREGVDEYGRTPLHYAAAESRRDEVAQLLAAGADANAQDDNGWTAMHFAAQAVSAECTAVLLRSGADISLCDLYGNTALWRAVFSSKEDGSVIRLLREAGSNPLANNNHGVSPTSLARSISNFDLAKYFTDIVDCGDEG
jgi:ankyrin repeat protein